MEIYSSILDQLRDYAKEVVRSENAVGGGRRGVIDRSCEYADVADEMLYENGIDLAIDEVNRIWEDIIIDTVDTEYDWCED